MNVPNEMMFKKIDLNHKGSTHIAFSTTANLIASCARDGTVQIWDSKTITLLRTHRLRDGWLLFLAFHPNGKTLAVVCGDGIVRFFDIKTGNFVSELMQEGTVHSVSFSSDGKQLATVGTFYAVHIWDVEKEGSETVMHRFDCFYHWQFLPERNMFATISNHCLCFHNAKTGNCVENLSKKKQHVISVACSPNEDLFACLVLDCAIEIWNLKTGKMLNVLRCEFLDVRANMLLFSPDGRFLISWALRSVNKPIVWDVATGKKVAALDAGYGTEFWAISFASDGGSLAVCFNGKAQIWDFQASVVAMLKKYCLVLTKSRNLSSSTILCIFNAIVQQKKIFHFLPDQKLLRFIDASKKAQTR